MQVSPIEPPPKAESADINWNAIAISNDFRKLLRSKARMIIPATIFFVVYYFALPVSVGYFPELMKTKVAGPLNLAYLFALSEFFMAWAIAALYLKFAGRFDATSRQIIDRISPKN